MDLALYNGEPLPGGIRRITTEHIQRNLDLLSQKRNLHKAIHESRKNFKKLRAIVRLIRFNIGPNAYKRENVTFRDASRKLSGLRDITAMLETLERINKRYPRKLTHEITEKAVLAFELKRMEAEKRLLQVGNVTESVKEMIRPSLKRITHIPLGEDNFSMIGPGLERIYTQGFQGLEECIDDPTVENLHEWRKRVKYLWYQILILVNIWPMMMHAFAKELHHLSELLGTDHDLAILLEYIEKEQILVKRVRGKAHLIRLIHTYRTDLYKEIILLGKKIYYRTPKKFTYDIESLWDIWREEYPVAEPMSAV